MKLPTHIGIPEIEGLEKDSVVLLEQLRTLDKRRLEIIEDCLDVLEPFIEEVIPKERKDQYYDYSEVIEIDLILEEYFNAA